MSAKSRGMAEADTGGVKTEFALPPKLVDLADAADTVLCY
jgi:hypothetical protein